MGARKKSQNGPKPPPPVAPLATSPIQQKPLVQPNKSSTAQEKTMNNDYPPMSDAELRGLDSYTDDQRDMYLVVHSMYADTFEQIPGHRDPWQKMANLAFQVTISSNLDRNTYAKMEFEIPVQFPTMPVRAKLVELRPRTKHLDGQINKTFTEYPKHNSHGAIITDMIDMVQNHIDTEAAENEVETKGMSLEDERKYHAALARDHDIAQREHELQQREREQIQREKDLQAALLREKQRRHAQYSDQEFEEVDFGDEENVSEIPFRFKNAIQWFNPAVQKIVPFKAVWGPVMHLERRDKRVTTVHPVRYGKVIRTVSFILKEIFIPDFLFPKAEIESSMDEVRQALGDCLAAEHPHVAKIYQYEIEHDTSETELSEWKITILTEKADSHNLLKTMRIAGCFKALKVRIWAQQLLKAMDFLEKMGYPHSAIHLGNIMFWDAEDDQVVLKVTDGYGLALRKLVDKARDKKTYPDKTPKGWIPPEIVDGIEGITNRTCVWQMGIVIIKWIFDDGYTLEDVHTSVDPLLARDDLREHFKTFLGAVFQPLPRKRPSPEELLSFQTFQEGKEGYNIPTNENPYDEPTLLRSGYLSSINSRWVKLFSNPQPLGAGSFGQVLKASYLIDGQDYAVKRIVCDSPEDTKAIWTEVQLLAKLHHPGVVRYYNAWQEDEPDEDRPFERAQPSSSSIAQPVRNRLLDPSTRHTAELDIIDPSMHRHIGAEYGSDEDPTRASDTDSSDDDSGGLFGYQSPPEDVDEDDEVFREDDPFANSDPFATTSNINTFDGTSDNIEFEADSWSNDNQNNRDHEVTSNPIPQVSVRTSGRAPPKRSILYIQMELCQDGTLRDLIVNGLCDDVSKVISVFRDILEALAHIHSNGMVHRDLKPTNIFLDKRGRPRIGDFGLAITSRTKAASRFNPNLVAGSDKGIGTQWYVAPELEDSGSGEYSTKADMFSLGVIFFQMCMPLNTEFERQNYLNQINRDPKFKLPSFFQEESHQEQGRILASLIDHDQHKRPSCRELLKDPAIPLNRGQYDAIRLFRRIKRDEPEEFTSIVGEWYDEGRNISRAQDLIWQNRGRKKDLVQPLDPGISGAVNDELRKIFRSHLAVESERGFPFPTSKFYSNAAEFMDHDIVMQLPFDLTYPFARMLAGDPEERPTYPKHYCFGTVFRRAHQTVAPAQFPEVDYDQISHSAKDLSLKDAEVIKVLDEILTEHTALSSRSFTIVLNHADLLDIVLKFAGVDQDIWVEVKRELSQLNVRRTEWRSVRDELLRPWYDIPNATISRLEQFNFQGNISTVKKKVNQLLDEESASKVIKTFARLEEIINYTQLFGVKTTIHVAPLSNNTEQLYQGSIMFKAYENKSRKILVVGGRYDRLIETLSFDLPNIRAVGFRINVSVLNAYVMAEDRTHVHSKRLRSRIDVIVTSFDEVTLHSSCIEIYASLLECKVRSEVSDLYNNMNELEKHYGDNSYWLVIVRPGNRIKVRNPNREEIDVKPSELVAYIKAELTGSVPEVTGPRLRRETSSHGGEKSQQRVIICAPSHKDKKVNRASIVDAATSAAHEFSEEMGSNAPIVAISSSNDTLELMRNTRLADDSSWRTLRQSVPAVERQYLSEIQGVLQGKADGGARGAFVVNYRTNLCIFYDFGKKL